MYKSSFIIICLVQGGNNTLHVGGIVTDKVTKHQSLDF